MFWGQNWHILDTMHCLPIIIMAYFDCQVWNYAKIDRNNTPTLQGYLTDVPFLPKKNEVVALYVCERDMKLWIVSVSFFCYGFSCRLNFDPKS